MGISTLQSYKGAQIFEAVGLSKEVINRCFTGTASRLGGVGFNIILEESLQRHEIAFGDRECDSRILRNPGFFHWRSGGEKHINDPSSIGLLQEATKYENKNAYQKRIVIQGNVHNHYTGIFSEFYRGYPHFNFSINNR